MRDEARVVEDDWMESRVADEARIVDVSTLSFLLSVFTSRPRQF